MKKNICKNDNLLNKFYVSVLIPTHNRVNLLERAINSVLNQTHQGFEIIVVSDGSNDGTDELMKKISKEEDRIKYISYFPPKGANIARNTAIEQAQYGNIAFLDDDDEWHPEKLEKQLKIFKENPDIGLVCTGVNLVNVLEGSSRVVIPSPPLDASKEILLRNCIGSTTTVMLKKNLINRCGNFDPDLKALQDYDLWVRVCQETKVGVVKEPCVEYYNYPGNNQISSYTERYIESIKYIEKKYEKLLSELTVKERNSRNNTFMLLLSKKGIKNNQPLIAVKYAFYALKYKVNVSTLLCFILAFIPYKYILKLKK